MFTNEIDQNFTQVIRNIGEISHVVNISGLALVNITLDLLDHGLGGGEVARTQNNQETIRCRFTLVHLAVGTIPALVRESDVRTSPASRETPTQYVMLCQF